MQIYPTLVVILGNSRSHNCDNKIWFVLDRFNRHISYYSKERNFLKSNCFIKNERLIMNKIAYVANNLISVPKLRFFKLYLLRLSVFSLIFVLSESVHAQGYSVILKIKDPASVCFPSSIDLTSASITEGSTEGLKFSYYTDRELKILVPNPKSVMAGVYYIKGTLTGSRNAWVASSVKVIVIQKPNVVITPSISISPNEHVDLTLPSITLGSDANLTFSYWYDIDATKSVLSPKSVGKGNYYIKGTTTNGCSDIKAITVSE
jgi:hypothetical protein